MTLIARRAVTWLAATIPLVALLFGCGGGSFGSELSAQPKARPVTHVEGTTFRLPADQPFNITLPTAREQPGLNGTADAHADAEPIGTAEARAAVNNGGQAESVFQIGHALSNATDRQADFEIRTHFEYSFEATASPQTDLPDATVGLRFYARTERGRLMRDMSIVDYTTKSGGSRRSSNENVDFTLTLAPGETVNVFLAGQAKIDVPDGRSASATLKLTGLTLEVTTHPAPAVRTAGHEQQ